MTGEPYAPVTRPPNRSDVFFTFMNGEFLSLKARQLLRVLGRLGYEVTQQSGSSHRWLEAEGRPKLRFAYHDRISVAPARVRKIFVKEVGLSAEKALKVIHDD